MRILKGNVFLEGESRTAVAFDHTGIVAYDQSALELGEAKSFEGFLTHSFMDGHAHPLFAGREHLGPDVTDCKTVAEIQNVVAEWIATNPTPHWAVGGAYDRSIVEGGVFLASWLDEVSPGRPVILHASDHHTIWVNSEAMRLAGVYDSAPKIEIGSVDVDGDGKPTGVFRETDAKELITNVVPILSMEDELRALEWSSQELLQMGITAVQDAWMDRGMVDVYLTAAKNNQLKVRTNLAFWIRPESWREDSSRFLAERESVRKLENPFLSAETVKFFADGVFGSATASVKKPYESGSKGLGEPVWSDSELKAAVAHFSSLGYQIHIHGIGDAGVASALDAIEAAGAPANSVIAHTELVAEEDIARFVTLGVVANFEPLWARKDGMLTSCVPHLGQERIDSMYRMRDILDTGATISFGSDWPVSSADPILGMFTAVHRALPDSPNDSWRPEQAVTPSEALNAYTLAVANQLTLNPRNSDFVILSADPRDNSILEIDVLETIIGGQTAFARQ